MKKNKILVLAILLVFVLAGCGKSTGTENTDNSTTNGEVATEKDKGKEEIVSNGEVSLEQVKEAPVTDEADFEYEEVEGGILISQYLGNDKIVVIPEKIDGKNVLELGEQAFANNEDVEGVKLADSTRVMDRGVFINCTNLKVIVFGKNIEEIGADVFSFCTSLTDVELNTTLKTLGRMCFGFTESLKEIYIPESVTEIDSPFAEGVSEVTIITEAGSAAEQYANENGFECKTK